MSGIRELLSRDGTVLREALSLDAAEARSESQSLLQHVLGVDRAYLLAHPEQILDANQRAAYTGLLQRRLAGEPIAYLLGRREFFGLDFVVTPATLIPRPETELLVELALTCMPPQGRVLDLGTGSGVIALSIAHARSEAEVTAVDVSPEALEVARENARCLDVANVCLLRSDWFSALEGLCFDLIVANPPYIATDDSHLAQGDLRFEPRGALASGSDGLADIRRIITGSRAHLAAGGWLLLEHGYEQAITVRKLLQQADFEMIFSEKDLAGITRVSGGRALGQA